MPAVYTVHILYETGAIRPTTLYEYDTEIGSLLVILQVVSVFKSN